MASAWCLLLHLTFGNVIGCVCKTGCTCSVRSTGPFENSFMKWLYVGLGARSLGVGATPPSLNAVIEFTIVVETILNAVRLFPSALPPMRNKPKAFEKRPRVVR